MTFWCKIWGLLCGVFGFNSIASTMKVQRDLDTIVFMLKIVLWAVGLTVIFAKSITMAHGYW